MSKSDTSNNQNRRSPHRNRLINNSPLRTRLNNLGTCKHSPSTLLKRIIRLSRQIRDSPNKIKQKPVGVPKKTLLFPTPNNFYCQFPPPDYFNCAFPVLTASITPKQDHICYSPRFLINQQQSHVLPTISAS